MKVTLRGLNWTKVKGRTYHYAWRGGPRLRGEPGTSEFIASYNEAIESRRTPDTGRFKALVVLYKASNDYKKLADSTRANWAPWLDRIADYFGDLRIKQFDRPEKIRPVKDTFLKLIGKAKHSEVKRGDGAPCSFQVGIEIKASGQITLAKELGLM
jgi:hypothetical protein